MDNDTLAQKIHACAFELWREDGALEGCEDEYWRLAKSMVEGEIKGKSFKRSEVRDNRDKRVPNLETV